MNESLIGRVELGDSGGDMVENLLHILSGRKWKRVSMEETLFFARNFIRYLQTVCPLKKPVNVAISDALWYGNEPVLGLYCNADKSHVILLVHSAEPDFLRRVAHEYYHAVQAEKGKPLNESAAWRWAGNRVQEWRPEKDNVQ